MGLQWVVFDLNGTVLDPAPISRALPDPFTDEATALDLLHETIFQSMADTLVGRYQPFTDYLAAVLAQRLMVAGQPEAEIYACVERAVTAAGELPAYPEAARAMAVLADAGLRIATITNSPTATAERALTAAGLRDRFTHVVGSDTCQAYKPAPAVYANGLARIGAEPERACMVAAHGWDLLGAGHAGMRTAWVGRGERFRIATLPTPDVSGDDLLDVAHRIVDLV